MCMCVEKQIDLKTVNLQKLRVPELKKILEGWGEDCKGCNEKSEFMSLVKKTMPRHDPAAADALRSRNEL